MLLTSEIVRAARARERRYVLSDGQGMTLHVTPWGTKWWRFRISPRVNLATARLRLAEARGLLARGTDPSADRRHRRAAIGRTFETVARDWFKHLEVPVAKGLVSADTLKDATRILERHIFPELGARSIGDIRSHELLGVLKQIELKGLRYAALRAKQRCSRVFRYACGSIIHDHLHCASSYAIARRKLAEKLGRAWPEVRRNGRRIAPDARSTSPLRCSATPGV